MYEGKLHKPMYQYRKQKKSKPAGQSRYHLKAQFYPAPDPNGRCIGKADLTLNDAILIRGISVLQQERGKKLSLRFPTYGPTKQSYVLPENKAVYMQMLQVIRAAVKADGFHIAEQKGTAKLSLSVTGELVEDFLIDGFFSLVVEGFCTLDGITTYVHQNQATASLRQSAAVQLPFLPPDLTLEKKHRCLVVFQGLQNAVNPYTGEAELFDYEAFIKELVLQKRAQLLQDGCDDCS